MTFMPKPIIILYYMKSHKMKWSYKYMTLLTLFWFLGKLVHFTITFKWKYHLTLWNMLLNIFQHKKGHTCIYFLNIRKCHTIQTSLSSISLKRKVEIWWLCDKLQLSISCYHWACSFCIWCRIIVSGIWPPNHTAGLGTLWNSGQTALPATETRVKE